MSSVQQAYAMIEGEEIFSQRSSREDSWSVLRGQGRGCIMGLGDEFRVELGPWLEFEF